MVSENYCDLLTVDLTVGLEGKVGFWLVERDRRDIRGTLSRLSLPTKQQKRDRQGHTL